ncbi:MAG: PQQ-binding-like beta-propeller repeat protein [Thermoplasmatales archaeon]|nr:MAG: PQQ-binding-like beta-propeller repeat protein [Thermoplasmatales archaeon]
MITNNLGKKVVTIVIIFLIILSLNLTIIVPSSTIKYENDGIWYDDLDDLTGISKINNCNFSNGSIKLNKVDIRNYDFADGREHKAWEADSFIIIEVSDEILRLRNIMGENLIDEEGYKYLDDNNTLETKSKRNTFYTFSSVHHFRFKTGLDENDIDSFNFSWWYGKKINDSNIDSIQLYVWKCIIPGIPGFTDIGFWENKGEISSYDDIGLNPDGDISVEIDNNGYVSNEGHIDFLIIAIPDAYGEACILSTDYVKLKIDSKNYGYNDKGYVVSEEIEPSSLGRWESIIWSGSAATDLSYVKIQVLTNNGTLIGNDDLPGNSEGFTTNYIDLSRLLDSFESIKINASLYSNDVSITPSLQDWAVTWQTTDTRFRDDFKTDLRLEKLSGAEIIGENIHISDSNKDWSIFGNTPNNARSYEGSGPNKSSLYWYTEEQIVGGGLRSPVISDGLLYIGAPSDRKIYAFNATVPISQIGKELKEDYKSSQLPYKTDSSVAVSDDLVIVATSEINTSNKIYALDKTDLTEEWNYSHPGTICFSSAPTIHNEKIFVTSWNGMEWNTPILSFLSSLILGGNNKIIALNLLDGTKIWDATLPAGSFSTPAISDDGMVFAGCDNILGNNLIAFDEETGTKIWEANVGLVGTSSPVVYGNNVFVVAKEQDLLSLEGDLKVFALNKYDGTILWNNTISESLLAFERLPKEFGFYNLMAASTPSVYENKLFVTAPGGKLYSFDAKTGEKIWNITLDSGILDSYACTAPVVTDDYIYVALADGIVYAVDQSGAKAWEFDCAIEEQSTFAATGILSSPIIADGVLYVSVTEELYHLSGRIYAIGNYTKNLKARVISKPIYVPFDKWWKKFECDNTTDGSIKYSILDTDYNVLIDDVRNGEDISDGSIVNTYVVRLSADLSRQNEAQDPILEEWNIIWIENGPPIIRGDTFIPDPDGWINTNTPVCEVRAYDVMPGLDVDSARYNVVYETDENEEITSNWIGAKCSGEDGATNNQTITADLSTSGISEEIADLRWITISIKDLAGYETTISKTFKKDMITPISEIENIDNFLSEYKKSVKISADAEDPGDENVSGIKTVSLYYKLKSDEEWVNYGSIDSPYIWYFNEDTSGEYEFCTIAKDKAGNLENKTKQEELSFIFDMNEPYEPEFEEEYRFNELPFFSIEFKDDYKLDSVAYRLSFHGESNWTKIGEDISKKSYVGEWYITQNDWDYMDEEKEYYIYFKLIDSLGNRYETKNDAEALKIVKDLTIYKSYLDLSDAEKWHWDNMFTISADIPSDSNITHVELYYRYSDDNKLWGEWEKYGNKLSSSPFEWKFVAEDGSGYYEFKTKVWDSAGNVGESPAEKIKVNIYSMIATTTIIIIIAIILIAIIFVFIKKKRV